MRSVTYWDLYMISPNAEIFKKITFVAFLKNARENVFCIILQGISNDVGKLLLCVERDAT